MNHATPARLLCGSFALIVALGGGAAAQAPATCAGDPAPCDTATCGRVVSATLAADTVPPSPQRLQPAATSTPGALQLHLDDERPPRRDQSASMERWFGWQTLLADGLSLGMLVFEPTRLPALGAMLLVAPIVHFANDDWNGGWASFGMRAVSLTLLFTGGAIAVSGALADDAFFASRPSAHKEQVYVGETLAVVGVAGMLTTMVLDAAWLAHVKDHRDESSARFTPWADPLTGSAGVQLWGRL